MTQNEYLEILFNDLQFDRAARNAYMSARVRRPVKFLDDLTKAERSGLIDDLKDRKARGYWFKPSASPDHSPEVGRCLQKRDRE